MTDFKQLFPIQFFLQVCKSLIRILRIFWISKFVCKPQICIDGTVFCSPENSVFMTASFTTTQLFAGVGQGIL